MNDLDSDAAIAEVLRQARSGLGPNANERDATLSRLSATLAAYPPTASAGGEPDGLTGSSPAALHTPLGGALTGAASKTAAIALIVGLAVGGTVGFGGGYWARSREVEAPAHASSVSASAPSANVQAEAEAYGANAKQAAPAVSPAVTAPAVATPEVSTPDVAHTATADGRRRTRATRKQTPPTTFTSDDEVAFVRRAQKALKSGDAALALGLMRTLDEQLPRGALMTERNVTRVLALCELGRTEEARSLAKRALHHDKSSGVYANRLAASCAQVEIRSAPSDGSTRAEH